MVKPSMTILIPVPCFAPVQESDRRAEKLGGKVAHAASEFEQVQLPRGKFTANFQYWIKTV